MKTATAPGKLLNAYRALLSDGMDGSKIKIQDVVRKAGVGRTTFYSYYDSVDELKDEFVRASASDINAMILEGHKCVPGQEGYVYIYTKIMAYIQTMGETARHVLMEENRILADSISDLIREGLVDYYQARHENRSEEVLSQTALFWTHGVMAMMREWVADGCKTKPEEMARLICASIDTCADFFKK